MTLFAVILSYLTLRCELNRLQRLRRPTHNTIIKMRRINRMIEHRKMMMKEIIWPESVLVIPKKQSASPEPDSLANSIRFE